MALENVLTSIREQGRKEADREVTAARKEAEALVAAAEAEAAAHVGKRRADGVVAGETLRKREIAAAELEAKKLRLAAEREVMRRIRAAVEERIEKLPAADREKHIATLAKRAGAGGVHVREQDAAAAKAAGVQVAGTFQGLGGVLVESQDRTTTEDLRYENLLDEVWRESLHDVAQIVMKGK